MHGASDMVMSYSSCTALRPRCTLAAVQDLLQEELHDDDLQQVKQSAQGLGVEARPGFKPAS